MLTSKNFSFESPIKSLSTAPIFNNDDSQSSTISTSSEVTRLSTSMFINNNILRISYASYIALIQNTLWCHRSELKIANKTYVPGWQTAKRDDVRELDRLHLQVCQTCQACHRPRSVLVHCQVEERVDKCSESKSPTKITHDLLEWLAKIKTNLKNNTFEVPKYPHWKSPSRHIW